MKRLTSRERLARCYRYQEVDRPGLFLRGVRENAPSDPSYAPVRDLIMAKGDLKFMWGFDHLLEPLNTSITTEPYSADFERCVTTLHTPAGDLHTSRFIGLSGQPGMPDEHLLKTIEDAHKLLSLPIPKMKKDVSSFHELNKQAGERGIVDTDIGLNPAGYVADLFGSTAFALFSIEHRDVLHALMEQRMKFLLHVVKTLIAMGVGPHFAMLGEEYVAPPLHGRDDFHEFNTCYDRPIADLVHESGGRLHVHCHGPLGTVLDEFVELGADVVHPLEPPPMGDVTAKQAKDTFRGKVCIEGNIQIGDMYTCSAKEIRAMAEALVEDAFDDRAGLIVCPSASPYVPKMTERYYQNVVVLVDVVTGHG